MTAATVLAFAAMAALLIMSPGPNGVLIAKTVPTSGRAAGFANIGGFVVAFFLHGTFAIFGLSLLLLQSANLFMAVKLAGAAYLDLDRRQGVARCVARPAPGAGEGRAGTPPPYAGKGLRRRFPDQRAQPEGRDVLHCRLSAIRAAR